MTKLLDKAFARASRLDPKQQDDLARQLLAELSSDSKVGEQQAGYNTSGLSAGLDTAAVKTLFKQAVLELLREQGDEVRELMVQAMEDAALVRAIDEGMATPIVDRKEVLTALGAAS